MSISEEQTQEIDQEAYQQIVRLVRERDAELQALRTELNELKEIFKRHIEEESKEKEQVLAYCMNCKHGLTNVDIQKPVCPYCEEGTKYTSQP